MIRTMLKDNTGEEVSVKRVMPLPRRGKNRHLNRKRAELLLNAQMTMIWKILEDNAAESVL